MTNDLRKKLLHLNAFSLIEVVLAMAVFLITVLTLVGLMGPALKSTSEIKKTDEVASVVDSVNAFLQSSTEIKINGSRFDAVYNAVQSDHYATILVFRTNENNAVFFDIGFVGETNARIMKNDIYGVSASAFRAVGPIYRVVITPSSAVPLNYHHATETKTINEVSATIPKRHEEMDANGNDISTNTYRLSSLYSNANAYDEKSFAMEVRIFAEDINPDRNDFELDIGLTDLDEDKLVFTYNTAILRY